MKKVIKRNGTEKNFDQLKIREAVKKAAMAFLKNREKADKVSSLVAVKTEKKTDERYGNTPPNVENIQDIVEETLMEEGYAEIAKRYIIYREERRRLRNAKSVLLGLDDDLKLTLNGIEVLNRRYLLRDDSQKIIETPGELFKRVARSIASAEKKYKSKITGSTVEEKFYGMMSGLEFLPNSPCLMNAGTLNSQLSACFVLPVDDSLDSIFGTLQTMAKIHQTGGGTGFNFSHLRPRNDIIKSTNGVSSGPVSFISIYDRATEVMLQGGKRRGANMGILRFDHPDIEEFIEAKSGGGLLSNFNLSVGVTDKFMDAVLKNKKIDLVNPGTGKAVKKTNAKELFRLIVNAAWKCGDPGLVFLDEINRKNPTPDVGMIEATNPCGELPLLPYESCNLGSINLGKMVKDKGPDFERLAECIRWGIRFLDDVIDMNNFPVPEITQIARANRKIGLGVMGFADMLIKCGIPYTSPRAVDFAGKIMKFVRDESLKASAELAVERGTFPNYKKSVYFKKSLVMRNATVNTIAPTGTISIIAGCSSGIEPLFGISFIRNILSGMKLFETNGVFESEAKRLGFYSEELISKVAQNETISDMKEIPAQIRQLFNTAFDVPPAQHLKIQAAFQKYTDNSVSKTINLPNDAPVSTVEAIYLTAHKLKCKGITVYRYGSRENQVLTFRGKKDSDNAFNSRFIQAGPEYSGGCISGTCPF